MYIIFYFLMKIMKTKESLEKFFKFLKMNFNNINNDMNNLNTPNVLIKYTSSIFNKSYENNDIDIRILDNKYLHLLLKDRNKNTLKYIKV